MVLQHDVLNDVGTVLVAPLVLGRVEEKRRRLHPVIQLEHQNLSLFVERLAAVDRGEIGVVVGTAAANADAIKRAIDIAFYGF